MAGQQDQARRLFSDFNKKVGSYVAVKGLSWDIEYLAGSLDCQFADTKDIGAGILRDALQNNRGHLNQDGESALRGELDACTAPATASASDIRLVLPQDIADPSGHFLHVGVSGNMKSGSLLYQYNPESAGLTLKPASELQSHRVQIDEPQKALEAGLARIPGGATGAVVQDFAVITTDNDKARAIGVGNCLKNYEPPLKNEFEIQPSAYMVTVYTARMTEAVYEYAHFLHGVELPQGVIAYSVADDMSLVAVADPHDCGSAAHELVHLLIKRNFPVSPAWLEEGLASEVAVASPSARRFILLYSWRDDTLKQNPDLRPSVSALLELPWSSFNTTNISELRRVAAFQAMAAVFIRYLDSKGKLSDVYFAVRDHHLSPNMLEYKSYREIVEEKLGMSATKIDQEFERWFSKQKPPPPVQNGRAPGGMADLTVNGPIERLSILAGVNRLRSLSSAGKE